MSIFYKVYSDVGDTGVNVGSSTYSSARGSIAGTSAPSSFTQDVGQRFATPTYTIWQGFLQFDLSAVPAGGTSVLDVTCQAAATLGGDTLEVHQASAKTNKIAGASIAGLTSLGSIATPTTTGHKQITMTADPTRSATSYLLLSSGRENSNTAPTGLEQATYYFADNTGTTNDPFLQLTTGTSWVYVGRGTSVEATATSHILTEPAGVAAGDLLIACIGSRIASTTSITLPSGWTLVAEAKNNNTLSTTSALPSGMMAYILRGGSAPSYTFTHPVAPNVALGRVVAYRNVHQTTPADTGTTAVTTGTAITAVSVAGLTTTADDDLIVGMAAGGQEAAWSSFDTTDPVTSSGSTADSVLDPIFSQWLERSDIQTITGNDGSLAIFDAVKSAAGATGNITATASVSAGHVVVAGSFKLAPPAPTGTTYDETVAETAAAAETLALLTESLVRETEAADWRETEDGNIRITEGDFFVSPPIEDGVAESASAADTVSAERSFICAVAENAGANETIAITLLRIGTVAESAAATDTTTGLLIRIGAVAETAAAAESTDATIVPAAGIFDVMVVETAPAVDTTDALVAGTRAIIETASAAETIGKTLSLTSAVSETAAAADTVGGLAVRAGAIAESAAAVETTAGLLIMAGVVAESASAAETITYSVSGPAGTVYNEAVLEVAVAADTVGGGLTALGAVVEAASAFETTTRTVSYTLIVAETAAAAETIGKTVSYSGAVVESATAAETIGAAVVPAAGVFNETTAESASAADAAGGLLVFARAVAETAGAVETIVGLRSTTATLLESAAAAETIGATVVPYGGTVWQAGIFETAAATDTVTADLVPGEVVPEPPPPIIPITDVDSALAAYFPGIVVQANLTAAISYWIVTEGAVTADDVPAILALANAILATEVVPPAHRATQDRYGPVPYPSGMPRFPNSNPTPDGWTIVDDGTVTRGGPP